MTADMIKFADTGMSFELNTNQVRVAEFTHGIWVRVPFHQTGPVCEIRRAIQRAQECRYGS